MIGQRIGNYRIIRQLGVGGMGAVYEAVHEQIRRRAAIKVLRTEYARNPEVVARFLNEAKAVNLIGHPSVVSIYELGQLPDGDAFIIMEYLEGDRLSDRLRVAGEARPFALRMARQIAEALAAAHDKGIVHRDLKPDNVMIVPDPEVPGGERVKVLDFGIAKMGMPDDDSQITEVRTRTGMLMGTPKYMSPEQCRGAGGVDDRADVYALGVVLYELLAGRPPFVQGPSEGPGDLLARHLNDPPPPLLQQAGGVSKEVAALVHAMLAKRPGERPSMRQVVTRLDGLLSRVVESRTAFEDAGASATAEPEEPGQHPSTLGKGTGETRPVLGRRRGRTLAASIGLGALATIAVMAVGLWGNKGTGGPPAPSSGPGPSPPGPMKPPDMPAAPRPRSVPAEMVDLGPVFLGKAQVAIGEFRRFVEQERTTRKEPWPWVLSKVPPHFPMNNISQDLAARYCRWRHPGARLPRMIDLLRARAGPRPPGLILGPQGEWTGDVEGEQAVAIDEKQQPRRQARGTGSSRIGFRCALERGNL